MTRRLRKGFGFGCSLAAVLMAVQSTHASAQAPMANWVNDKKFAAAFDMYWRASLLWRYAGNRVCSLKEGRLYDDPKSPFRPLDQRFKAARGRFEQYYPKALSTARPSYLMPPSQMHCEDERSAWEAIFGFETAVTALERLLDNLETRKTAGGKN